MGINKTDSQNNSDEDLIISKRDWRLQAITTLAEDFHSPWTGIKHKAGTPLELVGFVRYGTDLIHIKVPSAPAIYLSMAHKAASLGIEFFEKKFENICKKSKDGNLILSSHGESEFFDALENLATCVVFSYSAIEAIANQMIPDDYQFEQERSDGRCRELYSKDQIERYVNLETKMNNILPNIRKVRSPKGTKLWQNFMWLKELRDRLIHLKTTDCENSTPENADEYIWTKLLLANVPDAPKYALDLIKHYYPTDIPRWIVKFPSK